MELKNVQVIILGGGFGTRLRPVISDRPKILTPIGTTTVLDIILDHLFDLDFCDITLSVGYMKDKVHEHMTHRSIPKNAVVSFSEEDSPLGTGGALKKALGACTADTALVLNGDTIFPIDYRHLLEKHAQQATDISIALCHVDNTSRYGTVLTDETGRVIGYKEKEPQGAPGVISGGVYSINTDIFQRLELPTVFSLEKDLFEKYLGDLRMRGFIFSDHFIDIGLPEDYWAAQKIFAGR